MLAALMLALSACAPPGASPDDRAVDVITAGCGDANDGLGRGVLVDATTVLTAAHVVAGASRVSISGPGDGGQREGLVTVLDADRDLAVVALDRSAGPMPPVEVAVADVGDDGRLVPGSAPSERYEIIDVTMIEADRVRRTGRAQRHGYAMALDRVERGYSGAGLFDRDGRLVGVLFAVSTDGGKAWAVSGREIAEVLAGEQADGFECDPATARLELAE